MTVGILGWLDEVAERSDLLIIATPHKGYRDLRTEKPIVDVYHRFGRGVRV